MKVPVRTRAHSLPCRVLCARNMMQERGLFTMSLKGKSLSQGEASQRLGWRVKAMNNKKTRQKVSLPAWPEIRGVQVVSHTASSRFHVPSLAFFFLPCFPSNSDYDTRCFSVDSWSTLDYSLQHEGGRPLNPSLGVIVPTLRFVWFVFHTWYLVTYSYLHSSISTLQGSNRNRFNHNNDLLNKAWSQVSSPPPPGTYDTCLHFNRARHRVHIAFGTTCQLCMLPSIFVVFLLTHAIFLRFPLY